MEEGERGQIMRSRDMKEGGEGRCGGTPMPCDESGREVWHPMPPAMRRGGGRWHPCRHVDGGEGGVKVTHEASPTFIIGKFDGILGLGFPEISVGSAPPIWQSMQEQKLIEKDIFSFWLNRDPDASAGGELVFGGVDKKHYKGKHTYVLVTHKGYSQFDMGDLLIGGESTGFCAGGCAVIVDSGISLLAGPMTIVAQVNHAIGAEGIITTECKEVVIEYGEMILEMLVAQTRPQKVCSEIGVCI
ncbi:hypothetical protein ZWY2020_042972 [Hordeum vulgare]|nr:hypothetical protein ZWY2020_042972 [Hordeum vulgare]